MPPAEVKYWKASDSPASIRLPALSAAFRKPPPPPPWLPLGVLIRVSTPTLTVFQRNFPASA